MEEESKKEDFTKNKICEIEYLIGYKVNCKMKFEIKFPSLEQQKRLILVDEQLIKHDLFLCSTHIRHLALEFVKIEEIIKVISDNAIKYFIDEEFPPLKNEIDVETFE